MLMARFVLVLFEIEYPMILQAAYNLTGADLSPSNPTMRKGIQTALRKALGPNVNVTLLNVTAAGQPANASSSASDGSTVPTFQSPDGSIAGERAVIWPTGGTVSFVCYCPTLYENVEYACRALHALCMSE